MKRALIGGFLSLLGSIWTLAIVYYATNNMVISWDAQVGRLITTIMEHNLMFLLILSVAFMIGGIVIMGIELFRKEK